MAPSEMEDLVQQHRPLGLKFNTAITQYPVDGPLSYPFLEIAERHALPVMIHCPSEEDGRQYVNPQAISKIAIHFPDVPFVLAHLGGLRQEYSLEMAELSFDHDNLYLNTAGVSGEKRSLNPDQPWRRERNVWRHYLGSLAEWIVLNRRIMFGSDFPWLEWTPDPVDKLPERILEDIFYRSAADVYGLPAQERSLPKVPLGLRIYT